MKSFSITDIPEFSKKERIVVVGVIGKSPYRYPNKTSPLLSTAVSEENGVQCYWDERNSILYLHATTYLDTKQLTAFAAYLNDDSKSTQKDADAAHWLVAAGELSADSCKAIALLFHLSHIVVLSSPTSVLDLGYLQLFKAIDAFRAELQASTTEALKAAGLTGTWQSHGRCCCPRLLFHFRRAPRALRDAHALKRTEHAIEDQLYFVLRKARIITNICANSLFAIPKNEEFVYLSPAADSQSARDVSALVRGLVSLCAGAEAPPAAAERPSFKQFLMGHVELAFAQGFDDNVGKYAMSTSFFELPGASSWRLAARAIAAVYLNYSEDKEGGTLYESLATDVRFSEARCAKVLPIAQASYSEGLPPHYSSQHHEHKMSIAISVLEQMARGPCSAAARDKLARACEATWRSRRLCEARSLTNHACVRQEHDGTKDHSSGVRYVSACNCGRTKTSRDDPYSVRRANLTFYTEAAVECGVCDTLLAISFPVFEPSTPTYRAAAVRSAHAAGAHSPPASPSPRSAPEGAWSPGAHSLTPGEGEDKEEEGEEYDVVAVRHEQQTEKCIVRQPSTTEYLPGMLHSASPAGLLPAYTSWSLLCLGASSLYSHGAGLAEHLQPGFLSATNYLLPWDCAVSRMEQVAAWRAAQAQARGRGSKPPAPQHLTVKIFIGFEYECPRGHRFILSPTEPGARSGSTGGARCASADMPLYSACACRGNKPMLAQCMRVHVVTPKAPLHVTLQPQVQPVAGGPTFVPQPDGSPPIKLTASAYWVLRLPYIYCDERGPMPRPTTPVTEGRIRAPMFGLAD